MKCGAIALGLAAILLAGCERTPQPPPAPPAPVSRAERPSPIRWNAATGAFEWNGAKLRTARQWIFDGSTDGFTAQHGEVTPGTPEGLAVTLDDPTVRSPSGLAVPGKEFQLVLVRLSRVRAAKAEGWSGHLFYTTQSHPEAAEWYGVPLDNVDPQIGETVTYVYDMGRQPQGAPDWANATIDQFRLDLDAVGGGQFVIHQVAVAAAPPGSGLGVGPAPAEEAVAPEPAAPADP